MTPGDWTDYAAVESYLFGLKPRGTKLGLQRMRPFAEALGHPELALPCVHIAGTNGKGSVAAMIESVLRECGWNVGLYTSPHLVHLGERVQVNRQPLSENQIIEYTRTLNPIADQIAGGMDGEDRPSFFEFMSAMAFLEFAKTQCDIAVIEVGLGGEFDATNIVQPEVSVITSIGLDHCEWLGQTKAEIARAKAGIVKEGRPTVIGRLPEEAEREIRSVAEARSSRVLSVRTEYGESLARYPTTNLAGDYQRWNAGTASLALRSLHPKWQIEPQSIDSGLHSVNWPGRWQRMRMDGRILVLDAAHNAEAAAVLDDSLANVVAEMGRAPIVVVGALGLDRARPLLATICRYAKEVHLVVPSEPRALSHDALESCLPADYAGKAVRSEIAQLFPGRDLCNVGAPGDVIVVTGSIYLLGEVMQRIR